MTTEYQEQIEIIENHLTEEGHGVFIPPEIVLERLFSIFSNFIIKEAPSCNFRDAIEYGSKYSHDGIMQFKMDASK